MFKRLLIANRGEIACRIIKTARLMGIHSTVIYSSADADSQAVRMADNAVYAGEAPSRDSYLNIDRIIQLAQEHAIEAIHPGYGFLSENAEFAEACSRAKLIFIGPGIEALRNMASKQLAKQILQTTEVPLTPGYHGEAQDETTLIQEAKKIGYPILLKAALGGGGKGMRTVHLAKDLPTALAAAKREALASFGNDKIIIEKLISNPRHVEVQIMADSHGNVVHLFERDCSIQRRHQKIIEEAPAPNLNQSLRQKICNAAITVAKTIHYQGAGTVEFLIGDQQQFYFMEMNTRLQVEHPVSELITGQDFVRWQFEIAAGHSLPLKQTDIHCTGHAIECRVYAEDPDMDFMPSPGKISYMREPDGPGVRVDSGVTQGDSISRHYDPMIAKLIVYGGSREEAIARMQQSLTQYHIAGVKHNLPFLSAVIATSAFQNFEVDTGFLQNTPLTMPKLNPETALKFAVCCHMDKILGQITDPILKQNDSWQHSPGSHWYLNYLISNQSFECCIEPISNGNFWLKWDDHALNIHWKKVNGHICIMDNQGTDRALIVYQESDFIVFHPEGQQKVEWVYNPHDSEQQSLSADQLTAPMPSSVVAILKHPGDTVAAGDALIILEAMKMEHTIHAPSDGCIAEIFCSVGAQVNEGVQLISINSKCMETA